MWAKIVRERFGSESERSQMIRFHTQTGGVTLQAQQPEVNIIRVALQGFAAVCGGTQSLHTNGFDEALALPTERSARIALRTQQVIAHESGAADTVDPFAGSYFVESLTDEIETRSWELIEKVGELGGSVEALDFIQREIEESALSYHERYKTGQDIVVGRQQVRHRHGRRRRHPQGRPGGRAAPEGAAGEVQGQPRLRRPSSAELESLREVARGEGNLLLPIREALAANALDRGGLQRDARRVWRVQGWGLFLARNSSLVARRSGEGRDRGCRLGSGGRRAGRGGEPRAHGIEGQAHPGQIGARALGARGRPRADAVVDERPRWLAVRSWSRSPIATRSAPSPGASAQPGADGGSRSSLPRAASAPRCGSPPSTRSPDPGKAIAALEGLLDELGSPGRRPFGAA